MRKKDVIQKTPLETIYKKIDKLIGIAKLHEHKRTLDSTTFTWNDSTAVTDITAFKIIPHFSDTYYNHSPVSTCQYMGWKRTIGNHAEAAHEKAVNFGIGFDTSSAYYTYGKALIPLTHVYKKFNLKVDWTDGTGPNVERDIDVYMINNLSMDIYLQIVSDSKNIKSQPIDLGAFSLNAIMPQAHPNDADSVYFVKTYPTSYLYLWDEDREWKITSSSLYQESENLNTQNIWYYKIHIDADWFSTDNLLTKIKSFPQYMYSGTHSLVLDMKIKNEKALSIGWAPLSATVFLNNNYTLAYQLPQFAE